MYKVKFFDKPLFYMISIIYIVVSFSTLAVGDQLAKVLFDEDRYFENMGALGFFLTAFVFFYGFLKAAKPVPVNIFFRIRQLMLLGFAVMFFFGGGEEISWGQRIFNVQTPAALAEINVQGETNIHNIGLFEYMIPFETVFDLLWLSLTIALPLAVLFVKPLSGFIDKFFFIPRIGIGFLFLFNYIWAKLSIAFFESRYIFHIVPFIQAVQEIKESNYALLFVLVAIDIVWGLRRKPDPVVIS